MTPCWTLFTSVNHCEEVRYFNASKNVQQLKINS